MYLCTSTNMNKTLILHILRNLLEFNDSITKTRPATAKNISVASSSDAAGMFKAEPSPFPLWATEYINHPHSPKEQGDPRGATTKTTSIKHRARPAVTLPVLPYHPRLGPRPSNHTYLNFSPTHLPNHGYVSLNRLIN